MIDFSLKPQHQKVVRLFFRFIGRKLIINLPLPHTESRIIIYIYDAFIHFHFAGTADCSTRENCQNIFLWTFMDRAAITHVREQRGGDTGTL